MLFAAENLYIICKVCIPLLAYYQALEETEYLTTGYQGTMQPELAIMSWVLLYQQSLKMG